MADLTKANPFEIEARLSQLIAGRKYRVYCVFPGVELAFEDLLLGIEVNEESTIKLSFESNVVITVRAPFPTIYFFERRV